MKARLVFAGAATALGFLLCPALVGSPPRAIVEIPLTVIHAHLYVPVSLTGQAKSHWWLVDTGSPWSLVNVDHAKLLVRSTPSVREEAKVVAGKDAKALVDVGAAVNGYPIGYFDFFEAYLSDMIAGNSASGGHYGDRFEAGGVMGVNFLEQHRAILNFRSQRLVLGRTNTISRVDRVGLEKQGYCYVPIQLTAFGRIEVIGSVGANSYSFLIDSGSPLTILQSTLKDEAWFFRSYRGDIYFALGQIARAAGGRLSGFRLGAQDLSGRGFLFARMPNVQTGFSHPLGGIIGEDFLSAYQAILDIADGALYLKPRS
jgi:hypothetical protein